MVKLFLIPAAIFLALGALLGYHLQRLESIGIVAISKQDLVSAIAALPPKQIDIDFNPSKRGELERKYSLCTGSKADPKTLSRLDDKTLNDLVYQVCSQKS